MNRKTIGIVLFDEVEVLDFCGPFEVFLVARVDQMRRRESESPFRVVLVSEKGGVVTATGGLRVLADHSFADCPPLDLLCVPGGWGTRKELSNPAMLSFLRERAAVAELVTSVCTGSMLLGFAGLLKGRRATTHWKSLDWMAESFTDTVVERDLRVVDEGNLVTSAGISAGIDMALHVVARYFGEEARADVERHMEYTALRPR